VTQRTEPARSKESGDSPSRLARRVGQRIRQARLLTGLSRVDFGAKVGVSGQQIHKYEIGKDSVPLHRLLAIAAFCGIRPEKLWGETGNAPDSGNLPGVGDVSALHLVRAYNRISSAELKKRLLQLVRQMAGEEEGDC